MSKVRKILISAFIALNILAMVRMHLPLNTKYFATLYRPIDSYLSFFSIYQDWMMFAPNPSKMDVYITAKVEFHDGTSDTYDFEKASRLGLAEKYVFGERFRKFTSEALRKDENQFMWKDAAKFAMRKVRDQNFHKIPVRVRLTRHWALTPDVNVQLIPHRENKKNYETFNFYTYEVI